jgi:hypothetical protein
MSDSREFWAVEGVGIPGKYQQHDLCARMSRLVEPPSVDHGAITGGHQIVGGSCRL